MERVAGKTPDQLRRSRESRPVLGYLWAAYMELLVSSPLTYQEILAWGQLTGRQLTPMEVKLLMRIDQLNPFPSQHHG